MIRSGIPCTSMSMPAYDVPRHPASDALSLTACLLWSPVGCAVKTLYIHKRETPTISSSEITWLLCIPSVRVPLSLKYIGPLVGVRCVCSSRVPSVLTSFWRFRLLICLCPIHSLLGCIHKIWNYEVWNLEPNFLTGFVDPVESTGISIYAINFGEQATNIKIITAIVVNVPLFLSTW